MEYSAKFGRALSFWDVIGPKGRYIFQYEVDACDGTKLQNLRLIVKERQQEFMNERRPWQSGRSIV